MPNVTKLLATATLVVSCLAASASFAAPVYELTLVPAALNGSPQIYRLEVTSGTVSFVSGSNYAVTSDPQAVPPAPTGSTPL